MEKQVIFLLSLTILSCVSDALLNYPVCDGSSPDSKLQGLISDNFNRLMELRRPNWGWVNTPEVVIGLQLSNMTGFFGLNNTLKVMEEELKEEMDDSSIGKLGLYALAVKATCRDPQNFGGINIIKLIQSDLKRQFRYDGNHHKDPSDGWYSYSLAIQALCVCDERTPFIQFLNIINGQNEKDGSYSGSVDHTQQVLLALTCIRDQVTNRPFQKKKVNQAILKASSYLISQKTTDMENVWIGNKYSTPGALLALMEARVQYPFCREAAKSISNGLGPNEAEGAISQRLPAMSGQSVLSLKSTNWTCVQPVPIPVGYEPTYNPQLIINCDELVNGILDLVSNYITVRLSVLKSIGANVSGPYDSTIEVQNVMQGRTLLQVMTQAQCLDMFTFETKEFSFGASVTSVAGIKADTTLRQYWSLINANTLEFLSVGVSQYVPKDGDNILFKLSTY